MRRHFVVTPYIKHCVKGTAVMAVCILLGFALMVGVYAIPVDAVRANTLESLDVIITEGMYPCSISGYAPSKLDNFTDAIMMGNAVIKPEKTLLENALLAHRLDSNAPADALRDYIEGNGEVETIPYSRYWHGYLVVLKPLLCALSCSSIRYLLMTVQIILVVLTAVLFERRQLTKYTIALIAMYISICPAAVMDSLTYSSMFIVGMCVTVLMLAKYEQLKKIGYGYVFLVVGALTSYVDFLTYPVFTLGIPLVIYILLTKIGGGESDLHSVFGLCFAWGIGYAVMWASKWVLVTLLTDVNGVEAAVNQILLRTDHSLDYVGEVVLWAGLESGLEMILNPLNTMILFVCTAICVILMLRRCAIRKNATAILSLLMTALLPVAWMIFACNHTVSHAFFAYRNLAVLIFAVLCALLKLSDDEKEGKLKIN